MLCLPSSVNQRGTQTKSKDICIWWPLAVLGTLKNNTPSRVGICPSSITVLILLLYCYFYKIYYFSEKYIDNYCIMYYQIKFRILSCMKGASMMESRWAATHHFTSWNAQRKMPCKWLTNDATGYHSKEFVNTNMVRNSRISINSEDTPYHFLWNYCQSENIIVLYWKSLLWISFVTYFLQII